jgi:signal transduction histidine kinase/ActR/RegA family two-component response regulator
VAILHRGAIQPRSANPQERSPVTFGLKTLDRADGTLGHAPHTPTASVMRRSGSGPAPRLPAGRHAARFVERDAALCESIAELIGAGLGAGDPVLVILREAHRAALVRHLEGTSIDVPRACTRGQLTMVDAVQLLESLTVDGELRGEAFEREVGALVRAARSVREDRPLRVYGEMAALLCERGNLEAAARLEAMWLELADREAISMVCGYASDPLRSGGDGGSLPLKALDIDGRSREVVLLQERASALETEAQHERAKLRQLFMQSPALIVILRGPEHAVEFVNAAAGAMLGEELTLGAPLREALPAFSASRIDKVDHVFSTGKRYVGDAEPSLRDWDDSGRPTERFFNVVYDAYRDADGKIEGVMLFGFDVTEEVRARRKLEAAAEELESANRTKDDFLATVSHELRTPLNAILGWVRMLRGHTLPEDKRERALETIERNATVQTQLIEDLLDVSRIISGKLRLDVGTLDVSTVVENSLEAVRPAAAAKGISLRFAAAKGAGPILGDPERLQQVMWNLLTNAVKFTPAGGAVEVDVRTRGATVEIAVSDSGQGIGPEFLPHVFERFRQADGTVGRKHGGLGLGLAIVRHLVELHGGRVKVESEGVAKGAVFTVCLPISPKRAFSFERAPALRMVSSPELRLPKELDGVRVVVVDDEPDARELLAELLASCDATVWTASSAAEALDLVREHLPDVLVSDIGMPGEDGYALIKKLRALPAEEGGRTPAVALTAYARVEDRTKALVAGFHMHVPKPVEASELLSVLTGLTTMFRRA